MKRFRFYLIMAASALSILVLISMGIRADLPLDLLIAKYGGEPSRFMELDGMQVHYRDTGKGDPIVLIHGNSASLHTWDDWAARLEQSYRVIRLDLPGFGLTGPQPEDRYDFDYLADFVDRFLAKLQVSSIILAGNSHGGGVAWIYAAAFPDKVEKLVLIDSVGFPHDNRLWLFRVRSMPLLNRLLEWFTPRFAVERLLGRCYGDKSKITPQLVERYHELALRPGNRRAANVLNPIYKVNQTSRLKSIESPTLILWGALDQLIPVEHAALFGNAIKNSHVVIYPNVGHMPMEEAPKESLEDFMEFLSMY